jgi:hypothetical protein
MRLIGAYPYSVISSIYWTQPEPIVTEELLQQILIFEPDPMAAWSFFSLLNQ